ncbi:hypothetical protein BKA70DRAFT_1214076 [Coprinopsis sp. MPI-PUGE-AT-0042]|nr:hypothetical protein BKA70DRAFT_1214076 [Coprinopsis sp. MPI-PUGE-AT-0042]
MRSAVLLVSLFAIPGSWVSAAPLDIRQSTCVDAAGTSTCANLQHLCADSGYYTLMSQQCARTCGSCPSARRFLAQDVELERQDHLYPPRGASTPGHNDAP